MNSISKNAADVDKYPTANDELNEKRNAKPSESAGKSSSAAEDKKVWGDKEDEVELREWDTLSRTFAIEINPDQPDLIAALIFNHISFRLNLPPIYAKRDGKYWYFRSLRELAEHFPYLSEDEIYEAINRLEAKEKLEVRRDGKYGPTLWFTIAPKIKKAHDKTKLLWLRVSDATKHGVKKALLLGNLSYQFENWKRFKTDNAGNRYGHLSPSVLAKRDELQEIPALPMSRRTIINKLNELCDEDHALIRHPDFPSYYALNPAPLTKSPAEADSTTSKSGCDGSKTDERPVQESNKGVQDPNGTVQESNSDQRENARKVSPVNDLRAGDQKVYCNIYSKVNCKGNSIAHLAPTSSPHDDLAGSNLSSCANKLIELIASDPAMIRQNDNCSSPLKSKRVTPDQLPYDDISGVVHELPYDHFPILQKNMITTRSQEITEALNWIRAHWRAFKVHYTASDIANLKRFFEANPLFRLQHWQEIEVAIGDSQTDEPLSYSKWDNGGLFSRVKTARARLHYLPQLIHQLFIGSEYVTKYNGEECLKTEGKIEEPYASLNFEALDTVATGDFFQFPKIASEIVEIGCNPIPTA